MIKRILRKIFSPLLKILYLDWAPEPIIPLPFSSPPVALRPIRARIGFEFKILLSQKGVEFKLGKFSDPFLLMKSEKHGSGWRFSLALQTPYEANYNSLELERISGSLIQNADLRFGWGMGNTEFDGRTLDFWTHIPMAPHSFSLKTDLRDHMGHSRVFLSGEDFSLFIEYTGKGPVEGIDNLFFRCTLEGVIFKAL